MRSITLSESALRLPPCPKPVSLLPLNSFSKKRSSKLSFRNPCLTFSRYSRQWCEYSIQEAFRHFLPMVSKNFNGLEVRGLDCQNFQASRESMPVLDDICFLDKLSTKVKSIKEDEVAASTTSYGGLLKFMLLVGYLTFQGSQQAFAGTDIAVGSQSIPYLGDLGDISTGFASALLAARNSAATVFTGTFGALAVMTIISVVLGRTFHYVDEILPFRLGETDLPVDDIAAVCLLVYFGVSTLIDASSGDGLKAEDEQKEAELAVSEFSGNGAGILAAASTIISTFVLVFVAEWGDKSFFSTIALAAASSPLGVIGGALAGHGVATLIAVLGGSLLGTLLSEKVISYIGGVLFLVFAAITLIEIVN
ncbi:GDT1-like protein 1, chloroplastic isoform X2 [Ricinus communis]|uniref:GDT1-like protein 1, chloroplastic isoform X2 n=1 Tax=Ricinus communis TaxID=3988 RepID=UPI0007726EC2|nr:GDT1-like protein 1, chloroplastic isoform X2 [Ricinus communis]